jgi:hypothetical protein
LGWYSPHPCLSPNNSCASPWFLITINLFGSKPFSKLLKLHKNKLTLCCSKMAVSMHVMPTSFSPSCKQTVSGLAIVVEDVKITTNNASLLGI